MPKSSPVLSQTDAIGRYQVLRRLARGGMAEVLLARVSGLEGFEKLVVIKKILPELTDSPEFVEMFLDEARVLAQLQHSNIAQVYDIGSYGGAYFISMEFLHGQDLRTITRAVGRRGGRLPLEHVLLITASVCAGLHYAHEKIGFDGQHLRIVHRDISPHNVFITYDGAVKLLDFGVAKTARRSSQTRVGVLKGKIGYMAPEQCRSDRDLDRRADVYSVGVLMWEMLTGERLHRAGSDFEIMTAICEEEAPRPSTVRPCDPTVERMVMRALSRDRGARYQTAKDLLEELEELARARRLKLSAHDLSLFVRELFAQQIATWESARQEGKSLGEHMLDVTRADRYPSGSGSPASADDPAPGPGRPPPRADRDAPTSPDLLVARASAHAQAARGARGRLGGAGAALLLAIAVATLAGAGLTAGRRSRRAADARARAIAADQQAAAIRPRMNQPEVVAINPPPSPPPPPSPSRPSDAPRLGVEVATSASGRTAAPAAVKRAAKSKRHRGAHAHHRAAKDSASRAPNAATPTAESHHEPDADSLDVE